MHTFARLRERAVQYEEAMHLNKTCMVLLLALGARTYMLLLLITVFGPRLAVLGSEMMLLAFQAQAMKLFWKVLNW